MRRRNTILATLFALAGCKNPCGAETVPRASGREVLPLAFGVSQMAVRQTSMPGETAVFRWDAPAGTTLVQCAEFVCEPTIAPTPTNACPSIVNYSSCVWKEQTFEAPTGEFALSQARAAADRTIARSMIESVSVACWAYDGRRIIAASSLVNVRIDELDDELQLELRASCGLRERTLGDNCFLAPQLSGLAPSIGSCGRDARGPRCMPRCRETRDCLRVEQRERLAREADGGADSSVEEAWFCPSDNDASTSVCAADASAVDR